MITLTLKDKPAKKFNLNDFDVERRLYDAWYSMHGEDKFENKIIKITTKKNEHLEYKITEILNCEFENSVYVSGTVHTS